MQLCILPSLARPHDSLARVGLSCVPTKLAYPARALPGESSPGATNVRKTYRRCERRCMVKETEGTGRTGITQTKVLLLAQR
jgi:hypothetical protein